jgi:hypothetical protein
MERFSGCFICLVPQAICHSWEEFSSGGRQGYRRRGDGDCQFRGVILNAVSAAIGVGDIGKIREFISIEAGKMGIQGEDGEDWFRVWKRWMGSKVRVGDVETSGLGRLLYEFGDEMRDETRDETGAERDMRNQM